MSQTITIGKAYKVNSSRKGKFTGQLLQADDTWATFQITQGKAKALLDYNEREQGETVTVRRSLCAFAEVEGKPMNIIELARAAELGSSLTHNGGEPRVWIEGADWHNELTRFAALVRAAALEEAAVVIEDWDTDSLDPRDGAAAIRQLKDKP